MTIDPEEMDPDPFEQLSRQEKEEYEVWSEWVEKQFTEIGGQDERQRNQSA